MAIKQTAAKDRMSIRGMFRLQIEDGPTGKIVGDTGWRPNLITNTGFLNIVNQMGTTLIGSKINAAGLGTGAAPAATDNVLAGEVQVTGANSVNRATIVAATSSSSKTLRHTATFASSNTFESAANNISNVGLFSTTGPVSTSGSLLMGNTFASSACATNQNVNVTYDLILA